MYLLVLGTAVGVAALLLCTEDNVCLKGLCCSISLSIPVRLLQDLHINNHEIDADC